MDDAVVAAIRRHIQTLETLPMSEFERGVVHGLRLSIQFHTHRPTDEAPTPPSADVILFRTAIERRASGTSTSSTKQIR